MPPLPIPRAALACLCLGGALAGLVGSLAAGATSARAAEQAPAAVEAPSPDMTAPLESLLIDNPSQLVVLMAQAEQLRTQRATLMAQLASYVVRQATLRSGSPWTDIGSGGSGGTVWLFADFSASETRALVSDLLALPRAEAPHLILFPISMGGPNAEAATARNRMILEAAKAPSPGDLIRTYMATDESWGHPVDPASASALIEGRLWGMALGATRFPLAVVNGEPFTDMRKAKDRISSATADN